MEIDKGNTLELLAGLTIVCSLAAIYFCIDMIVKPVKPVGFWTRNRWLRVINREDYVGRHRFA